MTIRCRFKIDSIDMTNRHADYERDADGKADKSKPTLERTATVSLSAVDPNGDKAHENSLLWKGRAGGRVVLTNVEQDAVKELAVGKEYFIDLSPTE